MENYKDKAEVAKDVLFSIEEAKTSDEGKRHLQETINYINRFYTKFEDFNNMHEILELMADLHDSKVATTHLAHKLLAQLALQHVESKDFVEKT